MSSLELIFYFCRAQKYQLQKDGIVTLDMIGSTKDLSSIDLAKRMVNACRKLIALTLVYKRLKPFNMMKEEKLKGVVASLKL